MKEKVLREFKNGIYPVLLFVFSVFVNRSLTFDSHSLGVSMQEFANTFPSYEGVLQPQRILLPFIGFLTKLNLQFINLIFLFIFLYLIYSHMITYQSRFNSLIVCLSISSTMVVQFHLNFGAYPDILSYLLLLLVYKFKNNKFSPYLLFFLALLTKETAIFTFLFFISLRQISKIKLILSVLSYVPIYMYLSTGVYGLNHYFSPILENPFYWLDKSSDYIFLGYFSSIKFLWIFIFIYLFQYHKHSIPIYFLTLGISLQFILGGDTTRFVSFIFLGLLYIFEELDLDNIKILNVLILLLNVITYKYYVFAYGQLLIVNQSKLSFLDIYNIFNFS